MQRSATAWEDPAEEVAGLFYRKMPIDVHADSQKVGAIGQGCRRALPRRPCPNWRYAVSIQGLGSGRIGLLFYDAFR